VLLKLCVLLLKLSKFCAAAKAEQIPYCC